MLAVALRADPSAEQLDPLVHDGEGDPESTRRVVTATERLEEPGRKPTTTVP
jgi:hypothetical protein